MRKRAERCPSGVVVFWALACFLASFLMSFLSSVSSTIPLAYADDTVTVVDLFHASEEMDGAKIVFQGEAIGDVLSAGDGYAWVTLKAPSHRIDGSLAEAKKERNTTNASVSVLMTSADSDLITHLGRYHVSGTTLEITGVYNLACEEHQGQSDVHASSVKVISPGAIVDEDPDLSLLIFGVALIFVGCVLVFLFRVLRERQR